MLLYLNEYHVASSVYTFHLNNSEYDWVECIRKEQTNYKGKRQEALDQAEQRPFYLDLYEDNEEECAVFNMRQMLGGESSTDHPSVRRLESTGSVDTFLPNMDGDMRRLVSSSHSFDNFSDLNFDRRSLQSPGSHSNGDITRSRSPHGLTTSRSDNAMKTSPGGSPSSSPRPSCTRLSQNIGSRADTDTESRGSVFILPNRPDLIFVPSSEAARSNMNLRHKRNEKRYHTADNILELRKDRDKRDNSIYKRLSLKEGCGDGNIEDRSTSLTHKAFSSDSLRSVHSSSGVSSTGSLHLSPESEICEELEEYEPAMLPPLPDNSPPPLDPQYSTTGLHSPYTTGGLHITGGDTVIPGYQTPSQKQQIPELTPATNADTTDTSLANQNKTLSKSMPDISEGTVAKTEPVKSKDAGRPAGPARQMSHVQILRMKKQLLLNSTLETS